MPGKELEPQNYSIEGDPASNQGELSPDSLGAVESVDSYLDGLIAERTRDMTYGVMDPRTVEALSRAVRKITLTRAFGYNYPEKYKDF